MQIEIKDNLSFFKHLLLDFLAEAFHYPYRLRDIQDLKERANKVENLISTFCDENTTKKFEELKKFIDSVNNIDKLTEIEVQFVELDKPYNLHLSLYESINRQGYYDLVIASEIRSIYNKLGVDPKEEADLLPVELGFLSFLYFNKAIGNNQVNEVLEYFTENHIDNWVPVLAENLKKSNLSYFTILGDFLFEALKCIKKEV
ncbi:molecular chaperone TorD family protein [Sulfurisphaera ohwakuensis]|uniref:molecular chaperone TorD family protein n=1 Tax=Sulfurisphaera ohwakuensis TaxID=69656 RepID=UPI0036F3A702